MLNKYIFLCFWVFLFGYLLTYLLYKTKDKKFSGSTIQTKIHMWIPIYGVVLLMFYENRFINLIIICLIILAILHDYFKNSGYKIALSLIYLALVVIGLLSLYYVSVQNSWLFIAVWLISVMSDVFAYFAGNIFNKHKLPRIINKNKSWGGVVGQFAGALFGFLTLNLIIRLDAWLWLIVGFGSASGDVFNSYIKRQLKINDWSNKIPGHGGVLDRMSSLSFSFLLVGIIYFILN